jgi:hypothetical protein
MDRPRIYLAVILPMFALGALVAYLAVSAYASSRDIPIGAVANVNGILIALPTLVLWIPLALLLSNAILRTVAPLRRVAEHYVAVAGRPDFDTSQRQLGKFLLWSALVCVPLIAVGWWM